MKPFICIIAYNFFPYSQRCGDKSIGDWRKHLAVTIAHLDNEGSSVLQLLEKMGDSLGKFPDLLKVSDHFFLNANFIYWTSMPKLYFILNYFECLGFSLVISNSASDKNPVHSKN